MALGDSKSAVRGLAGQSGFPLHRVEQTGSGSGTELPVDEVGKAQGSAVAH